MRDGGTGEENVSSPVENRNDVGRILDHRAVVLLVAANRFFSLFPRGDVAIDSVDAKLVGTDADGRAEYRDVDQRSIFFSSLGLPAYRSAMRRGLREELRFIIEFGGDDQVAHRFSDRFRSRVAKHRRELTVHALHGIVHVKNDDGFGSIFEELLQVRLLDQRILLGFLAIADIARDALNVRNALVEDQLGADLRRYAAAIF